MNKIPEEFIRKTWIPIWIYKEFSKIKKFNFQMSQAVNWLDDSPDSRHI